jgi:formate hydrogenlyase subunit 3/multisubunit Na+/H+ antiporter MnhD subunit
MEPSQLQAVVGRHFGVALRRREFVPFMLLSCATLGLYTAYLVLAHGAIIGELIGRPRPRLSTAVVLTIITLGVFPGVYVVVLAFDLQHYSRSQARVGRQPLLGPSVLTLDALSLVTALVSGGVALVVSVAAWSYGCWLLFRELNLYAKVDA